MESNSINSSRDWECLTNSPSTSRKKGAQAEWFTQWFSSPYYPVLYRDRDEEEAEGFIRTLLKQLGLQEGSKVLDLACGRGRHARFLHEYGLDVYGFDLSADSIAEALRYEKEGLHFLVHDMREPFPVSGFDAIFNLFTSFGYFEDFSENCLALANICQALKPGGIFVLDYFNTPKVISRLVAEEEKTLDGIRFEIHRYLKNHRIYKEILVDDPAVPEKHLFVEQVQALTLEDFEKSLKDKGFEITERWGDYHGTVFDRKHSDRLILFSKKV